MTFANIISYKFWLLLADPMISFNREGKISQISISFRVLSSTVLDYFATEFHITFSSRLIAYNMLVFL